MKRTSNDPNPEEYPRNLKDIFNAIDAGDIPFAIHGIRLYASGAKAKNAISSVHLTESTDKAIFLLENGRSSEAREELNQTDTLLVDAINNPSLFGKK